MSQPAANPKSKPWTSDECICFYVANARDKSGHAVVCPQHPKYKKKGSKRAD